MARYYKEDCGPYTVSPILVTSLRLAGAKRSEEPPMCFPCLPRCGNSKPASCARAYSVERKAEEHLEPQKKERQRARCEYHHHGDCCDHHDEHCHHHDDCCRHSNHDCNHHRCHSPNRCHSPTRCRSPCARCYPTCSQPTCTPVKTKYIMPCYRYEDGRIERYVPTRHGRLPMSAYRRNGMQDQVYGYRGAQKYLCAGETPAGCCVCMVVEPMRRLFPKVSQLPVSAFKRNGVQDQEHTRHGGCTNFFKRCPQDVMIECDVCTHPVKMADPVKVEPCAPLPALGQIFMRKKPISVSLQEILDLE